MFRIFLGVPHVDALEFLLQSILVVLRDVVPSVVLSRTVDLGEILLGGLDAGSGVRGSVASYVPDQQCGILD